MITGPCAVRCGRIAMTRHTLFKQVKFVALFLAGNALLAFAVAAFIIPGNIITGGATGIGLLVSRLLHLDAALVVLVFNLVMLALGGIVLGKKFLISTAAGSVVYPLLLALFQRIPGIDSLTDNRMLSVLFGGGLIGIAIGTLIRIGSSTGGIDVLNLVVHKWTHITYATVAAVTDMVILVAQALFSNIEQILYGILLLAVLTFMLDSVMIMGKAQLQVFVISPHYETIRRRLVEEMDVGVTMMCIQTGYQQQDQQGVMCILPKRRLHAVHELISTIDPNAFITITQIKEVHGEGFSRARHQRIPTE